MNHKWIAVLLAAALAALPGCARESRPSSAPEAPSCQSEPVSSEPEAPSSSSSTADETQVLPQTADEAAERFVAALRAGDTGEMEFLSARYESPSGQCDYWKQVALGEISCEPIQSEGISGTYRLTMEVLDAGPTLLATGVGSYVMRVGSLGYDPIPMVLCIAPEDRYIDEMQLIEDSAAAQVMQARAFGFLSRPFETPDDLTDDLDVEYLIAMGASEYPDGLTQGQMDEMAARYYGAEEFVRQESRFYDPQTQLYVMLGRGGNITNDRIVRIDHGADETFLYVETYTDPVQVCLERTFEYHMKDNGDGTWQVITLREVEPLA